jgi:hypothetical protein
MNRRSTNVPVVRLASTAPLKLHEVRNGNIFYNVISHIFAIALILAPLSITFYDLFV